MAFCFTQILADIKQIFAEFIISRC